MEYSNSSEIILLSFISIFCFHPFNNEYTIQSSQSKRQDNFLFLVIRCKFVRFQQLIVLHSGLIGNLTQVTNHLIISIISIVVILFHKGNSRWGAILVDARCTKVCIYKWCVWLVSSGIYEWTSLTLIQLAHLVSRGFLTKKEKNALRKPHQINIATTKRYWTLGIRS